MSNENTNANNNDWAAREIGAMWKRDGQNQKYLSGKLKLPQNMGGHEVGVVMFTNRNKKQDNHPDFRLYLDSKYAPEGEGQTAQAATAQEATEDIL